jgi:hypothetical protein
MGWEPPSEPGTKRMICTTSVVSGKYPYRPDVVKPSPTEAEFLLVAQCDLPKKIVITENRYNN